MKNNARQAIIESVYAVAAKEGLENLSISKIYYYFASKEGMLQEAFTQVNREIDAMLEKKFGESDGAAKAEFSQVAAAFWTAYLEYFVANPQKTVFYNQYKNSNYISDALWMKQKDAFVFFNRIFGEVMHELQTRTDADAYFMIWSIVLNTATAMALRAVKTGQPVTENMKKAVYVFLDSLKTHMQEDKQEDKQEN